jgi:hypothetical protein
MSYTFAPRRMAYSPIVVKSQRRVCPLTYAKRPNCDRTTTANVRVSVLTQKFVAENDDLAMASSASNNAGFGGKLAVALASIVLLGTCAALTTALIQQGAERTKRQRRDGQKETEDPSTAALVEGEIRMAFCGNSILYYNDCPRLLQQMVEAAFPHHTVVQDSCLRGGANLKSLFERGNGMGTKFGPLHDIGQPTVSQLLQSSKQPWHFVILNDHTQAPARTGTADQSKQALAEHYVPMMMQQHEPTTTPILIQTPAYRRIGVNDSADLGDFDNMTALVREGLESYLTVLPPHARIAPVGEAYRRIRNDLNDIELWKKLYSWDDFHPSPYGTWLQACVIFGTMFHIPPPPYDPQWWELCRYMNPPDEKPLPLPTDEEAYRLWYVACEVTGVVVVAG